MKLRKLHLCIACSLVLLTVALALHAQECPSGRFDRVTNDFWYSASSAQGAVGDVVGIDLFATVDNARDDLMMFMLTGCFDGQKADLLDNVAYAPAFDAMVWRSSFQELHQDGRDGFVLWGGVRREDAARYFPSVGAVHLATLFFRVSGIPGDRVAIEFCDNVFRQPTNACYRNDLYYSAPRTSPRTEERQLISFSTLHQSGEIRILDGEPTNPDLPDLPPLARIYPEAPTPETASILFELSGAVARPGSREVPLEVHVTSNFEWSGYYLSLRFPAQYLELARVEEHTRPGAVRIDNPEGHLAVGMTNSQRRVGAEGERVRLATLYFNVLEAASEVEEVSASFEPFGPFFNWLAIHHTDGQVDPNPVPVTAQVEPLHVSDGMLRIQRQAAYRGDVNLDEAVDLTDAVVVLEELFQGRFGIVCRPAADFNLDTRVDVSDPIAILQHLYLGGPPERLEREVFCDE